MFNYFNDSLWEQINKQSKDFWEELEHFKKVNKQATEFCQPVYNLLANKKELLQVRLQNGSETLTIPRSKWNERFQLETIDCLLMALHKYSFR